MKLAASLSDLSPRQEQVARLIASGLRGKEIQVAIGIQYYTLRGYVKTIYKRTGTKGVVSLTNWVRDHSEPPRDTTRDGIFEAFAQWVRAHSETPRDRIFEAFCELKPAERARTIEDLVEIHQRKGDS